MPILLEEDTGLKLPKMHRVRQSFPNEHLEDVARSVRKQMMRPDIQSKIRPGARTAIAVGSRGINNLPLIVRTVIEHLEQAGACPFIIPAMGSHGGGTAKGQLEILKSYGISEETMGVQVISDTEVSRVGSLKRGTAIYFDQTALSADLVIPINRVKLHTDFVAAIQSGLCKMLVIGLGNHKGCSTMHDNGFEHFGDEILEAAEIIMRQAKIGFGLAIVENAYDQTLMVEAIASEHILHREKELVKIAGKNMATLMIPEIDILIVEEIGKNISGTGYDPNILGRSFILKKFVLPVPKIERMVLNRLSAQSHGNACGIGAFDIITRQAFEQINFEDTYANCVAVKCPEDGKIPLVVETEEEAVRVAIKVLPKANKNNFKIVRIKNTLDLEEIEVSDALLTYVASHPNLALID